MKLKTLLATLCEVEYTVQSTEGWTLAEGYVDRRQENDWTEVPKAYYDVENKKVVKITTVANNDRLYITVK